MLITTSYSEQYDRRSLAELICLLNFCETDTARGSDRIHMVADSIPSVQR